MVMWARLFSTSEHVCTKMWLWFSPLCTLWKHQESLKGQVVSWRLHSDARLHTNRYPNLQCLIKWIFKRAAPDTDSSLPCSSGVSSLYHEVSNVSDHQYYIHNTIRLISYIYIIYTFIYYIIHLPVKETVIVITASTESQKILQKCTHTCTYTVKSSSEVHYWYIKVLCIGIICMSVIYSEFIIYQGVHFIYPGEMQTAQRTSQALGTSSQLSSTLMSPRSVCRVTDWREDRREFSASRTECES